MAKRAKPQVQDDSPQQPDSSAVPVLGNDAENGEGSQGSHDGVEQVERDGPPDPLPAPNGDDSLPPSDGENADAKPADDSEGETVAPKADPQKPAPRKGKPKKWNGKCVCGEAMVFKGHYGKRTFGMDNQPIYREVDTYACPRCRKMIDQSHE